MWNIGEKAKETWEGLGSMVWVLVKSHIQPSNWKKIVDVQHLCVEKKPNPKSHNKWWIPSKL